MKEIHKDTKGTTFMVEKEEAEEEVEEEEEEDTYVSREIKR